MNLSFIFYCSEDQLAAAGILLKNLGITDVQISPSDKGTKFEGVCSIDKAQELVMKLGEQKIAGYSKETQVLLKPSGK